MHAAVARAQLINELANERASDLAFLATLFNTLQVS
jgi:hypothetical protein